MLLDNIARQLWIIQNPDTDITLDEAIDNLNKKLADELNSRKQLRSKTNENSIL